MGQTVLLIGHESQVSTSVKGRPHTSAYLSIAVALNKPGISDPHVQVDLGKVRLFRHTYQVYRYVWVAGFRGDDVVVRVQAKLVSFRAEEGSQTFLPRFRS